MPRDTDATVDFMPTRAVALARLEAFLPGTGRHYASTRNSDFGPDDRSNVSALSPFIRHRLLLETEVLSAVLARFSLSTAEKFVQEVFWRSYFKGYLEQRPSIWTDYRAEAADLIAALDTDADLASRYASAVEGRTGIDCFDGWVHELVATGYLHNHARMWFASIWIFTLRLPWQLGSDFFYRHLMDGDPASNTLSWRWVGGLHTKGKCYLARADNIAKYTGGRFAPADALNTAADPLSEEANHPRMPLPEAASRGPTDGRSLILLTEEDCFAETWPLGAAPVAAVAVLATSARSTLPVGAAARTFAVGAVADAARRASEAFDIDIAEPFEAPDWTAALREAAQRADARQVITAYAPVGPVAEKLAAARPALAADGIDVVELSRPLDRHAWPHATKGFFALKRTIPDILAALSIRAA